MTIKNIDRFSIPALAHMAEGRIIDTINLLDAILNEVEPQNMEADDNLDDIFNLCDSITDAYNKAKSALNELQQQG